MIEKSEEKGLVGRPRCKVDDNIKVYLQEICCEMRPESIWLRIGTICGFLSKR
jgi:hypothetical protein